MIYSRRLRVEQKNDKRNTIFYILFSVVTLLLLFKYGVSNVSKIIGFVGDFKNASVAPEKEDKTPPPPPTLDNIPKATKESTVEISGNTESGVKVVFTINGKNDEVLADIDGRFIYDFTLNEGENTLSAVAKDKAGNESMQSTQRKIIFDNTPPELEISAPADGSSYFGPKQKQLTITGKTDEGSKVQVNGRWVITNSDGSFSYVYSLSDNQNQLIITSEDEAGNKSEKVINVTYTP